MTRHDYGYPIQERVDAMQAKIDTLTEQINVQNFEQLHREIGVLQVKITSLEQPNLTNIMDWSFIAKVPEY